MITLSLATLRRSARTLTLMLSVMAPFAQAAVYRCVDANGGVSYQAQPCMAAPAPAPQASDAETETVQRAAPGSMNFDLVSLDGHRLAWTSAGPINAQASAGHVLGGGPRTGLRTMAVSLRDDDAEAYALENNGSQLTWFPKGLDGPGAEPIAMPPNLPALSSGSGTAWNTQSGVLAIVSHGGDGYFYRYDTHNHRWLDAHALKYQEVMSVAHNAVTGGYVALSGKAELLVFNENAELVDVRPLAQVLPQLSEAREGGVGSLEGLMVVAQGDLIALINVRDANVTHIWTYSMSSRQAQLSYRMAGLRSRPTEPKAAAVAAAASSPAAAVTPEVDASPSWTSRINPLLNASPDLPYLAALILLGVLLLFVVWHQLHPTRRTSWRTVCLLIALALAALPLLMVFAGRPEGRDLLMSPMQLWQAGQQARAALKEHVPLTQVFNADARYQLVATSACAMVLVALFTVLLGARWAFVRVLTSALILILAVAPARHLIEHYERSHAFAQELAAGDALFDARCRSAGVKRVDVVGAVEGVRLTGVRGESGKNPFADRDWPEAAIPDDLVGSDYIKSFLDYEYQEGRSNPAWSVPVGSGKVTMMGYRFVDVPQADGSYRRYSLTPGSTKGAVTVERIPTAQAARYAVSYARSDTPEDRQHWIAGATVTVTDTRSGVVLAEARTFAHAEPVRNAADDVSQRNWRGAKTCLSYGESAGLNVRTFAEEALQRLPR